MEMAVKEKYRKLVSLLDSYGSVIIAFSGGVDSSLLLKVAHDRLGTDALAVTVRTDFSITWELDMAKKFTHQNGIDHTYIDIDVLKEPAITSNPSDRCYHCKVLIFKSIQELAKQKQIDTIIEGSNSDDTSDYRPGTRAIQELDIKSPLKEVALTKDEIRFLSKQLDLNTWNTPSSSCLATRIPYGMEITEKALERIEDAEAVIRETGISQVRVRDHGDIARIEIPNYDFHELLHNKYLDTIILKLKSLGYTYVTIDMEGYRTGSMNETLDRR